MSTNKNDDRLRSWGRSAEPLVAKGVIVSGALVRMMSRRQAKRFAGLIGGFMHEVLGLRRELVHRNISLTFPEKSPEEVRRIAAGVYRNVAETFVEVLRFPLIKSLQDVDALVDIDVTPFLEGTDGGRSGAVMLSAHYGNWELMALAFGMKARPGTIIVKELTNKALDQAMNRFRSMHGNSVVYSSQAVREGLRILSAGGLLAILGDQSDPGASVYGEFLGRRATMFQGAAFFALRAKVPLFVVMCRHGADGRYKVEIREVESSDLSFGKEGMATLARRYTDVFEEYVRKWPEEWFWLHNRWKNG